MEKSEILKRGKIIDRTIQLCVQTKRRTCKESREWSTDTSGYKFDEEPHVRSSNKKERVLWSITHLAVDHARASDSSLGCTILRLPGWAPRSIPRLGKVRRKGRIRCTTTDVGAS
ncbi:hypothetical protein KM043_009017 [Ampulex compressa]|nr:hypothetical protein KM043_009017 [Ampulex compressa]